MESEKIYNLEIQIKKLLEQIIQKFIISKENVTVIDLENEENEKIMPTKENLEIDILSLKNKMKKEYKSFKTIIEKSLDIKAKDFKIINKFYNNNFLDINNLINSIYNCQFKKIIEKKNQQKSFFKTYKLYLFIFVFVIILLIGLKYYKK